jgi:hypothetical protein
MCLSTRLTSKWLFVLGVPKLSKLKLTRLWGPITLCANLRLRWGLKQSYSPCRELSNGMSHATFTQGNRVDFWLLVVRSQITNLIPDFSFGHNLCFRYPNGSCEPILDIYIPIAFQWYKKLFKPLGLTFAIAFWTFESPPRLEFQKWKLLWECEGSWPSHFPSLPGFSLGLATLQAFALVVSPRLGLRQKHWINRS